MIIVVCTDDPKLTKIAEASARSAPNVFGNVYRVFGKSIPRLGADEHLFLVAHGAKKGDDNNPVIGSKTNAFYVNAVDLYKNISGLFPAGYQANIYVDACESADNDDSTFSFTEALKTQVRVNHGKTRLFGRNGAVSGLVPQPAAKGWQEA